MATVNITVHNDHDFNRTFQYTTVTNVPINITGAKMVMMLRRNAKDEAAQLKLTTETGEITLISPTQGKFAIRIPQDVLEKLGTGTFDHSLVMTLSGSKHGIWTGIFTNNPGAAR